MSATLTEMLERLRWLRKGVEYAAQLPKHTGVEHVGPHIHDQYEWGVNGLCGTYACRLGWALYLEGLWDPEKGEIRHTPAFQKIANIGLAVYFGMTDAEEVCVFDGRAEDDEAALAAVDEAITRHKRVLQEADE